MRYYGGVYYGAARMCLWLRGRVCGCADVSVAVRTCLWLHGHCLRISFQ